MMTPASWIVAALVVNCIVAVTAVSADPCAALSTCKTCAGINGCGWCSRPITYTNGTLGPQCAGPSTSSPFTCSGIYSTNQCLQGFLCDQTTGKCMLAPPGQGVDKAMCAAACTTGPTTKVYGCKAGTTTCVEVPAGTPGSSSLQQCKLHCSTPAAKVYACNQTTQTCVVVAPGTPGSASKEVCEAVGCDSGTWGCDLATMECREGFGNSSKDMCDADCRPINDPCEPFTTCDSCLAANPVCGWCSANVTYANGQIGGQCAGVNKTILPFNCLGTYSTKSCGGATTVAPTPTTTVAPTPTTTVAPTPTTTVAPPPPPTTAAPAPPQPTPSPYIPPYVACPRGSTLLLQYNCADENCDGCNSGTGAMCMEPHCTLYCSGMCQPVPYWDTSFSWTCNGPSNGWTNATLVHYLDTDKCTGPTNPPGVGGSGTYTLNQCGSPYGPNNPPQYNTFMCVPCGASCDHD